MSAAQCERRYNDQVKRQKLKSKSCCESQANKCRLPGVRVPTIVGLFCLAAQIPTKVGTLTPVFNIIFYADDPWKRSRGALRLTNTILAGRWKTRRVQCSGRSNPEIDHRRNCL